MSQENQNTMLNICHICQTFHFPKEKAKKKRNTILHNTAKAPRTTPPIKVKGPAKKDEPVMIRTGAAALGDLKMKIVNHL